MPDPNSLERPSFQNSEKIRNSYPQKMRLITVHIPPMQVALLDELTRKGFHPNRSEGIRNAITNFLIETFGEDLINYL